MQASLLGNPLTRWALALGVALAATLLVLLVRLVALRRLAAVAARTETIADDALIEAVRSVRKVYVLLLAVGTALLTLNLAWPARVGIRAVVIVVAVLQGARTGHAVIDFWVSSYAARRDGIDRTTMRAISYAARVALWVTIVLVGLEAAGFQVKTLIAGLGVGGIAIALAVQNILGDLFAALSIVLDKPFVVGDAIAVDQFEGEVVSIGLKSTRVRSFNGEEVVFANTDLLKSRLRNLTRRNARRYVVTLTLAPDTPAAQVQRVPSLIAAAVTTDGRATLQRAHLVRVGLGGAEVEAAFLIEGTDLLLALDVRQTVLIGVLERLEREGIRLARPALLPAA